MLGIQDLWTLDSVKSKEILKQVVIPLVLLEHGIVKHTN